MGCQSEFCSCVLLVLVTLCCFYLRVPGRTDPGTLQPWNPKRFSLERVLSPSTGLWLIQALQEVPGRTNGTWDTRDGTTASLIPGPKITDSCETWNLLLQLIAQLVAHWLVKPLKFVHNVRSVSSFSESIGKWQLANWEQLRTCAHRSHRSHRSHCAVLQAQLSRSIFI